MNTNRQQSQQNRTQTNYRTGDNRRPYHNNNHNGLHYRNGPNNWTERNRTQNDWRSDREYSRNGNRSGPHESRPQSSQSTHLPGIPVNRNQSSTAFVSNEPKVEDCVNSCANGCGDAKPSVESVSDQLSQIDINEKPSLTETDVTPTAEEVTDSVSVSTASEVKTESDSEKKTETKVVYNKGSVSSSFSQRRNTVGSDFRFQNCRTFQRQRNEPNPMNGNKFERIHNYQNKVQTNDPNKRIAQNNSQSSYRGVRKYNYTPPRNDYINYMPINPYMAQNMCDAYNNPLSQYLIPNSYLPNAQYGYGAPNQMLAPTTSGEMSSELATHQNQSEADRNGKHSELTAPTDPSGVGTHFVPFKPSQQIPVAPHYYGNIIPFNTDKGTAYYFQSVIPPNIALLPLEIQQSTGLPILPSNCFTVMPYYD